MAAAKTVSAKMGIKKEMRGIFINGTTDVIKAIDPPQIDRAQSLRGDFDYIHLFTRSQAELQKKFPTLRDHLKPTGMLWISWPKNGQMETDLNIKVIIKIGYDGGLVESKTLSINATWSAIKFTHPRKGKVYNNSYGKLKDRID
jgi:hypothetical protein